MAGPTARPAQKKPNRLGDAPTIDDTSSTTTDKNLKKNDHGANVIIPVSTKEAIKKEINLYAMEMGISTSELLLEGYRLYRAQKSGQ